MCWTYLTLYGKFLLHWRHRRLRLCCFYLYFYIEWEIPEAAGIDIGDFIFIFSGGPCYSLLLGKFIEIPDLDLIFRGIAAYQELSIMVIDRIASNMHAKDRFNRLSLSDIPEVEDRVPSAWDDSIVIDKLNWKDAVGVTSVIPLGTS
jgi:hypothetical protein